MTASTDPPPPDAPSTAALTAACQAVRVPITADQARVLRRYAGELVAWNERLNLTRITDPRGIAVRHIADSLVCLRGVATGSGFMPAGAAGAARAMPDGGADTGQPAQAGGPTGSRPEGASALRCIDVGSGAGLPGIPLAVVRPEWAVALLEATGKKARFLEHVADHLALANVSVEAARAETLGHDPDHREAYDLAVVRAVAQTSVLAEYCLPLLARGGRMLALKGQVAPEEAEASTGPIALLGGRLVDVLRYELPDVPGARHLVIVEKVGPTPDKYPRRPGTPSRRPLQGL